MVNATKTCTRCNTEKLLSEFSKSQNTVDLRSSHCRACDRQRHKERERHNREKHKKGPSVTEKRCSRCKETKGASHFTQNQTTSTGLSAYCSGCAAEYRRDNRIPSNDQRLRNERLRVARKQDPERFRGYALKKSFNLTLDDYNRMLENQGGVCAICGGTDPAGRFLAVDHDHECCNVRKQSCGKCVRGLLCTTCNNGLGAFKDSIELLKKAIEYLT